MGRKQLAWFVQHWLAFFETYATSYNWQKGKKDQLQGNVRLLEITQGNLRASVKGLDVYQVGISSQGLGKDAAALVEEAISQQPIKLMKIYQGTLREEDVRDDPHRLGFDCSDLQIRCTCGQANLFCTHSLAVAMSAAERFNDDYWQFLHFQGLNLESLLLQVREPGTDWLDEEFTLLPVPEGSIRSFDHRIGTTPTFWTSSFPFMRMLDEILQKIREEGRK